MGAHFSLCHQLVLSYYQFNDFSLIKNFRTYLPSMLPTSDRHFNGASLRGVISPLKCKLMAADIWRYRFYDTIGLIYGQKSFTGLSSFEEICRTFFVSQVISVHGEKIVNRYKTLWLKNRGSKFTHFFKQNLVKCLVLKNL